MIEPAALVVFGLAALSTGVVVVVIAAVAFDRTPRETRTPPWIGLGVVAGIFVTCMGTSLVLVGAFASALTP